MTTKQLSGPDAMFLHMELDGFPMLVGGAAIYDPSTSPDGVVRFTDILAMFESRLDRSPIFRRKLAEVPFNLDQPYWVDDPDFDLGYHLRHIGLPRPGDWRQFCNQIAELHSRPLDFGRPLWEAYIIEGLDNVDRFPPACFALYLKVHHCAIDGASGQTFIGAFNDVSPIPETAHPPRPWKPGKAPSNISMLTRAYLNGLRKPGQMLGMGKSMLASRKRVKEGLEAGAFQALGKIPTTRFNGELSAKRVVDATKFDFDSLRRIKNSVAGATINDVVLTIVGGALRKYLQEKAELPEQSLVTGCPVNVRDETEKDREGNMIAVMTTSLCTDVENPMERLQKVHAEALNAKAHLQAQGARAMVDFSESVPSALQAMTMKVLAAARIPEKRANERHRYQCARVTCSALSVRRSNCRLIWSWSADSWHGLISYRQQPGDEQ